MLTRRVEKKGDAQRVGKTSSAAKQRYKDKAYDRLSISVPKGTKELFDAVCKKNGTTMNRFVTETIKKYIEENGGYAMEKYDILQAICAAMKAVIQADQKTLARLRSAEQDSADMMRFYEDLADDKAAESAVYLAAVSYARSPQAHKAGASFGRAAGVAAKRSGAASIVRKYFYRLLTDGFDLEYLHKVIYYIHEASLEFDYIELAQDIYRMLDEETKDATRLSIGKEFESGLR